MMKSAIFLSAALSAAAPAWAVYKCTGPDGKTVFQDAPCVGKGGQIEVRPASGDGRSDFQRSLDASTEEIKKAYQAVNDTCNARGITALSIGMSKDDALCAPGWRFPKSTNTTSTASGVREQVVYGGFGRLDSPRKYLYFENGKLTAIQE